MTYFHSVGVKAEFMVGNVTDYPNPTYIRYSYNPSIPIRSNYNYQYQSGRLTRLANKT